MKRITGYAIALFSALLITPAHATPIPTQWVTNATAISNVFDAGPVPTEGGERPRLGSATSGFIEGTVNLPEIDDWLLQFTVSNDGNVGEDLNDFVRVFLDGSLVGDFTNTEVFPVSYAFTADAFTYRFEFTSSNSNISFHQIVNSGSVSRASVPAPGSGAFAVAFLSWVVARRRRIRSRM